VTLRIWALEDHLLDHLEELLELGGISSEAPEGIADSALGRRERHLMERIHMVNPPFVQGIRCDGLQERRLVNLREADDELIRRDLEGCGKRLAVGGQDVDLADVGGGGGHDDGVAGGHPDEESSSVLRRRGRLVVRRRSDRGRGDDRGLRQLAKAKIVVFRSEPAGHDDLRVPEAGPREPGGEGRIGAPGKERSSARGLDQDGLRVQVSAYVSPWA